MRIRIPLILVLINGFVFHWNIALYADDWPQWMGPNRDGVWRETGIVKTFPQGGPPVRWRIKIGGGYAGPAVEIGRAHV